MKINCCSFASENFTSAQYQQKKYFIKAGFKVEDIYLYNPKLLNKEFYEKQPNASEKNKFGWFTFKPYFILSILNKLNDDDILIYLDVNDKPLIGIKEYINKVFCKNKNLDVLAPLTNYLNIRFLSGFHRLNFSSELLFSSWFNFQPEAGCVIVKNSSQARSILWTWYYLTLTQAYQLDRYEDNLSRHDQETLYLLSRIYKSIKLESWLNFKLNKKGIRRYIEFESFRN
tara:strand:+ start:1276 stop:1962 length:687 start_codon:yes stop_codon:yes gene_type:complete